MDKTKHLVTTSRRLEVKLVQVSFPVSYLSSDCSSLSLGSIQTRIALATRGHRSEDRHKTQRSN